MVGHGGSSAGSYLADPTSPIPSHCASIVATNTLRVNWMADRVDGQYEMGVKCCKYALENHADMCFSERGAYTREDGAFTPVDGMPWMAGRYKVIEVIGKGQSSVVLKAQVNVLMHDCRMCFGNCANGRMLIQNI